MVARQVRQFAWRCSSLLTRSTKGTHQPLGDDPVDRRCQKEWFKSHVQQASDTRCGVIGVQRRKYLMSGQSSLHTDLSGFEDPHLANHDDIGILPED